MRRAFYKERGINQELVFKIVENLFRGIAAGSLREPDPEREGFGGVRTTQNCADSHSLLFAGVTSDLVVFE
jgi:hypothetical protein